MLIEREKENVYMYTADIFYNSYYDYETKQERESERERERAIKTLY